MVEVVVEGPDLLLCLSLCALPSWQIYSHFHYYSCFLGTEQAQMLTLQILMTLECFLALKEEERIKFVLRIRIRMTFPSFLYED